MTEIGWINDQVDDNKSNLFLSIILLYIVIASIYLYRIRKIDLKVRDAKINNIKKELKGGKTWVNVFDEVTEDNGLKLNLYLHKYAKVYKDNALESYYAIKFYDKHLKDTYGEFNLWQKVEVIFLSGLVIFSSIALLCTIFGISLDQIFSAFPSCKCR